MALAAALPALTSLTGGGGLTAPSSATSGVSGSANFGFGDFGVTLGAKSNTVTYVALGLGAVALISVLVLLLRKR